MNERSYQLRLSELIEQHPCTDSPATTAYRVWRREWMHFLFRECGDEQRNRALELYALHINNEREALR